MAVAGLGTAIVVTHVVVAGQALAAIPASLVRFADYPVAWLPANNPFAELNDLAGPFVTQDERIVRRPPGSLAVDNLRIRPAY
jgi:hypothetical protein